jgi:hypothetical protein
MTGPLVNVIVWQGSGSSPIRKTPFGLYDDDDSFICEAPKVAKWVCSTLGYPVMAVELTDEMIYGQFEQAISEFTSLVNEFNMRDQMLSLQGIPTGSSISQKLIKSNPLPYVIEVSQMYGTEAHVGGYVDYKKGYLTMRAGVAEYDLERLWADVSESGNRIEIRRVFHERPPAINRFFDPFSGGAGQGIGVGNLLGEFGWGSYSVASQYLLMPIYETLLRVQAIEFNDQIRRSQYSFEITNNKIRLYPLPTQDDEGTNVWFEYTVTADKFAAQVGAPGSTGGGAVASDYSNVPYTFMQYGTINDVGKRWIWKYTLGLCKIVLGGIRSKYDTLPIPNSEMRLDGLTLRQEGQREIEILMEQLRESLMETGKRAQMEKSRENEQNAMEIMKHAPNLIYIA